MSHTKNMIVIDNLFIICCFDSCIDYVYIIVFSNAVLCCCVIPILYSSYWPCMFVWDNAQDKQAFFFPMMMDLISLNNTFTWSHWIRSLILKLMYQGMRWHICSSLNPTENSPACSIMWWRDQSVVEIKFYLKDSSISTLQPVLPGHLLTRKTLDLHSHGF